MGSGASKKPKSPAGANQNKQPEKHDETNVTSGDTKTRDSSKSKSADVSASQEPANESAASPPEGDDAAAQTPPILSQLAAVDEDSGVVAESDVSYAEFPTHVTLRLANEKAAKKRKGLPKDKQGKLLPFPSHRKKADLFKKEKLQHVDKHCATVSMYILHVSEKYTASFNLYYCTATRAAAATTKCKLMHIL